MSHNKHIILLVFPMYVILDIIFCSQQAGFVWNITCACLIGNICHKTPIFKMIVTRKRSPILRRQVQLCGETKSRETAACYRQGGTRQDDFDDERNVTTTTFRPKAIYKGCFKSQQVFFISNYSYTLLHTLFPIFFTHTFPLHSLYSHYEGHTYSRSLCHLCYCL